MAEGNRAHRTVTWLVGLVVLLAVIMLGQSLLIFDMWRNQSVRKGGFASWIMQKTARLYPHEGRRPAGAARDEDRMLVLQSADELEDIHSRLNSILNQMMADYGRVSLQPATAGSRALPGSGHAQFLLDDIRNLQRELDGIFESFFLEPAIISLPARLGTDWDGVRMAGSMLFKDEGDLYSITVPMPGIDKSNIAIRLEGQMLIISADQRAGEQMGIGDEGSSDELACRRLETRIRLPVSVDADSARASYHDDALFIQAPKKTDTEPIAKLIEIN